MYSRAETSQARQAFWTAFGKYLSPQLSAQGEQVNWINYKTGAKHIQFRMDADAKRVYIGIELTHRDAGARDLVFNQFRQFQPLLDQHLHESWQWQLHAADAARGISRIFTQQDNINILTREDWPPAISFFKPRIIALDAFWSDVKYAFEDLR